MAKKTDFDFYCEEVLSGKTKIKKVYESDDVLAYHHTRPSYEFHVVIIPKEHIHDLTQIQKKHSSVLIEILFVAKKILRDLDLDKKGGRLLTNLGKFQDTPHLHFHVVSGKKIINK